MVPCTSVGIYHKPAVSGYLSRIPLLVMYFTHTDLFAVKIDFFSQDHSTPKERNEMVLIYLLYARRNNEQTT